MQGENVREPGASARPMPWFRMYNEAVDDEKLRLLAFEDRWHFVALLCCKGQGILEDAGPLLMRKVAVKLGIDVRTLEEVARRLAEVGLLDATTLQPVAWETRQMRSDSSAARVKAYRERMKRDGNGDVTLPQRDGDGAVTAQEVEGEVEKEKVKNTVAAKAAKPRKRGNVSAPEGEQPGQPPAPPEPADAPPLTVKALVGEGIERQHAADWIKVRRAKRLPLTQTAWDGVKAEAAKAGLTPAEVVHITSVEGWAGFKAKWLEEGKVTKGGAWWASESTALAMAHEVGVGPALAGESKDTWHGRIRVAIDNGGKPPAPRPKPVTPVDPIPAPSQARSGASDVSRSALAGAAALLKSKQFGKQDHKGDSL